ncbi:MFS general substrate transporter [Aulographum hederae CBS 113979]|uniref:MFS general substrate transporter n=1 Tax=Aulographum hederae CBS 113979 TaxID=1176131 RepID=A0A6G1HEY1_9PEZI|nr:MFS general substrate transporter [Aulographum hederae CBS 113979]
MKRLSADQRRRSSTLHYSSFPTKPPTSRGRPPASPSGQDSGLSQDGSDTSANPHESPLPKKQLAILAVIALAEQTALNSIGPYLPDMTASFPGVNGDKVGMYVGLIASAFALAQLATNFFWGWVSDRIGRKPVILLGTLLSAGCFVAFGFCRRLWQAILVHALLGLVNGNQAVVTTCLGEITDRSNQSRAFTYLPVVFGIGGITGPVLGGLLVIKELNGKPNPYPYLLPNLVSAGVLLTDLVLCMCFLEESLEEAKHLPPLGKRVGHLFSWIWQFVGLSHRPTYLRHFTQADGATGDADGANDDADSQVSTPNFFPEASGDKLTKAEIFNRDTVLLLLTFLIFQLANISFNSLFPTWAEAQPPAGRALTTEEIGLLLGFAGVVTIMFQVGIYGKLRDKIGNKITYRVSFAIFVAAFVLIPWVGYKGSKGLGMSQGKVALWMELAFVLILKTIAAVGGLTSAMLLITNSAPNPNVLGRLNGLAQTISAVGHAVGPFVAGSLFTAAVHIHPKGEALAFGVFGGVTFVGFLLAFGIRSKDLETKSWDDEYIQDENADEEEGDQTEDTPFLGRSR